MRACEPKILGKQSLFISVAVCTSDSVARSYAVAACIVYLFLSCITNFTFVFRNQPNFSVACFVSNASNCLLYIWYVRVHAFSIDFSLVYILVVLRATSKFCALASCNFIPNEKDDCHFHSCFIILLNIKPINFTSKVTL